MAQHSLTFSAWSVPRLFDGSKTQTRRPMKRQLPLGADEVFAWFCGEPKPKPWPRAREGCYYQDTAGLHFHAPCPYGVPGDRLIGKEDYQISEFGQESGLSRHAVSGIYLVDGQRFHNVVLTDAEWERFIARKYPTRRTPARFMYHSLSRIRRELIHVRVQRVKNISNDDALREGCQWRRAPDDPISQFRHVWDSIHGKGAWERNGRVWALTFAPIKEGE